MPDNSGRTWWTGPAGCRPVPAAGEHQQPALVAGACSNRAGSPLSNRARTSHVRTPSTLHAAVPPEMDLGEIVEPRVGERGEQGMGEIDLGRAWRSRRVSASSIAKSSTPMNPAQGWPRGRVGEHAEHGAAAVDVRRAGRRCSVGDASPTTISRASTADPSARERLIRLDRAVTADLAPGRFGERPLEVVAEPLGVVGRVAADVETVTSSCSSGTR